MTAVETSFEYAMTCREQAIRNGIGLNTPTLPRDPGATGWLSAARRTLRQDGWRNEFRMLSRRGRLDLSLEALALRPEFTGLFTEQALTLARQRLLAQGYRVPWDQERQPDRAASVVPQVEPAESHVPLFRMPAKVRLKRQPHRRGRIVDGPRAYAHGFEYLVSLNDDEFWVSEADLELAPQENAPRWQSREEFLRDLLLAKLRSPLADSLYAYGASRTQFVPYQFKPALKFLRNPDQRILIADEVGLGKTIEAAIIYLELKARLEISRVLVLCPSRLKTKWQDELRNRFEEQFDELDTPRLRRLLDEHQRFGRSVGFRAIASYETMRQEEFRQAFADQQIPIDLLIVDEAHYMRNADTLTYALGSILTDHADAVVFLTATPLHLRNRDLFNLLHLLAPGEFEDPALFETLVEPNEYLNQASRLLAAGLQTEARRELRKVENTPLHERFLTNPYYQDVVAQLGRNISSPRARVALQQDLLGLNTLSTLFTRTRKRDVEQAATRAAFSVEVELSPVEQAFYDRIVADVRGELEVTRPGAQSFAVIMKERQAASCLSAVRQTYEEAGRAGRRISLGLERSAFADSYGGAAVEDVGNEYNARLLRLSQAIGTTDSKFAIFAETLQRALAESPQSKALVFSFFRGTLDYLSVRLKEAGLRVQLIHGGVPIPERRRIIEEFRTNPTNRVLLSSEVGAEGLDFQFCDILMNYDLPWNPMQVEQRIGRLDRFGQTHARIRIYNFYLKNTVEDRIFRRLYERIGIFERSIGDLEAILGEVIQTLSRAAIQVERTPAEQQRMANEAADRIARCQLELEQFEQHRDELLSHERIFTEQVTDTVRSGRVLSAEEIWALAHTFLQSAFPNANFVRDGQELCCTLRCEAQFAAHLQAFMQRTRTETNASARFRQGLADHGRIAITFDSELARQRPNLEFVTVRHPLAGAAVAYWRDQNLVGIPTTDLCLSGFPDEVGDGHFFLYMLEVSGAQPEVTLQPVIVLDSGAVARRAVAGLLNALQHRPGDSPRLSHDPGAFAAAQDRAQAEIGSLRDEVLEEATRRNQAMLAARRGSIIASFAAKEQRARAQRNSARDERIRRMHEAQLRNLPARRDAKLAELARGADVVVTSRIVAGGRVRID